jgi:hypothetical protein
MRRAPASRGHKKAATSRRTPDFDSYVTGPCLFAAAGELWWSLCIWTFLVL